MTQTVMMVRNSLPLMQTITEALKPFPEALNAVTAAVAAAATPRNESAEVHVDEVEAWAAHGWRRAND